MAKTWGSLKWGQGLWGNQASIIVSLTGVSTTSSIGEALSYNNEGWGRYLWGERDWGSDAGSVIASPTGVAAISKTLFPAVDPVRCIIKALPS